MKKDPETQTNEIGERERSVSGMATGAPGTPIWLPDDASVEPSATTAPATGDLATSGRDDVERGDTVTGRGAGKRRRGVPPGPQSGAPTPGNRYDE